MGFMGPRQMAFVLWFQEDEASNLHVLNGLMTNGWKVVSCAPMSGTGEQRGIGNAPESRMLIILEHTGAGTTHG
jgi:hypothetical protein